MKRTVRSFIKKYDLTERNLSYEFLKQIFNSLGYKIIFFNEIHNSDDVEKIIEAYELSKYVSTRKSFLVSNSFIKLLFLHECMGEDELIHYTLHELGHIWLHHLSDVRNEASQEREADEFAVRIKLLLKLQHITRKISVAFCIAIMTLLVFALPLSATHIENPLNTTSPTVAPSTATPTLTVSDTNTETVCITKSGERFHRPDCRYINGKTYIISMSVNKAINNGYTPCKVCRPTK